jgi:pimeloyl-ACP methyl ester carboxylesterase
MEPALRYVQANGIRFAYLEAGEGPLVLLMHGFPDTARTWDAIRPRIAELGYRAVSPFMRGYHPTEVPARDADAETLAHDVLALIEALGEKSAILIGHDWGASAVYGAATIAPEKVLQLFALGIPHPATLRPTLSKLWGVRHFLAYKLPGAADRFAKSDFAALPALYRRWSPAWQPQPEEFSAVRACFAHRQSLHAAFGYYRQLTFLTPDYLKEPITVPTVVFFGQNDPLVTLDDYQYAARMFENDYTIEQVPGGHFLHREHPEEFAARLLAHL